MTVDVTRSLGWDSTTATATHNGSKGYANVFSAKDQPSRSVALNATNSVLSKSTIGGVIDVSSVCGTYDPSRPLRRETPAHHFFALKLNDACAPSRPVGARAHGTRSKRNMTKAAPFPAPMAPKLYTGGGHFVLESAPPGRSDLLSTLYCTGYEQRPHARPGDIVVAELRVRPASPGAPPAWARFFKERHASLHIARRGLDACMTGPHVHFSVPDTDAAGRRAVLARGQALEVVLAAMGTAALALEHDGLESKHWAWLLRSGPGAPTPVVKPILALAPAPAVGDNPGLASPDCEGDNTDAHSDDSQGPATLACDRSPVNGLFAGYSPSIAEPGFEQGEGGSVEGGIELDEWVQGEDTAPAPPPPVPAHAESPRPSAWGRKGSVGSRPSTPRTQKLGPQHHPKAGSWPEKQHRQSVVVLERKDSMLERKDSLLSSQQHDFPLKPFPRVWVEAHPQQERAEYYS
ncbi:hypothetical protein B0H19DRAFT_1172219 [Mycena capillaripes]|nr:hypothetical protein B0H19DRAFT_1172219 [Mycena capillaripes]